MKKSTTIAVAMIAVFGAWSAARGAVSFEYSDSPAVASDADGDTGGSQTVSIADFSTVANDLLIVSFGQEHNNGSGSSINNVQYGGVNMTQAVSVDLENSGTGLNTAHSSIWFIDPADGTGDITFDTGGTEFTRYMVNAVLVSGDTGPVVFDNSATNSVQNAGGNTSLTAGTVAVENGDFIIDSLVETDGRVTFTTKGLSENSGGVLLNEFGSGEFSAFGASYWLADSTQNLSTTWAWTDDGGPSNLSALSTASFTSSITVIPTPAALPAGLALLALTVMRRRR